MLYLTHPAQAADQGPKRVALSETTALRLERALLAADIASRREELQATLEQDSALNVWALRAAEYRSNRTINRPEEAAAWLAEHLLAELAKSLVCDPADLGGSSSQVAWRLPALVAKLHDCEQQLANFDDRLERAKLESLKELAYGASHEINNPLANIAARAQTLLADETDPERARKLQAIHRQAMRAHEMIADLMLFARPPKLSIQQVGLNALTTQIAAELHESAAENEVEITLQAADPPVAIHADRTQLGFAIRAIVVNAVEAVCPGGHVNISVQSSNVGQTFLSAGSAPASSFPFVEITIRDDGPGISPEVREHIFDPFFSGREAGRGLGFGLSKAWRIVTEHGGTITVQQPAGAGAEFIIRLPLANAAHEPA